MTKKTLPTGRATETLLDQLHNMTAQAILADLQRAMQRAEENPDDPDSAIPPQLIAVASRFLTSNKIDAPASAPRLENLNDLMKEIGVDLEAEALGGKHTGDARH